MLRRMNDGRAVYVSKEGNQMKKIILLMFAIMFFAGCSEEVSKVDYKQITTEEAIIMMAEESDYIILDVRTPEEYESGHIKDAINIPNEIIGDKEIAELPDKEQLIMIYCRSGNRSKQASEKLAELGYTNVVEFGGINTWTEEIVKE